MLTCILTLKSSRLTLHVKNDAPIVGEISFVYTFETYLTTKLVLPTPVIKNVYGLEEINCTLQFYWTLSEYDTKTVESY